MKIYDNYNKEIIEVEDDSATHNATHCTKIIGIKPETYERLKSHSRRYYNIETYDIILIDLLDCYNKQHEKKYYF
jgi:hypothetical protein